MRNLFSAILFLVISIVCFVLSYKWYQNQKQFEKTGLTCNATIIDIQKIRRSSDEYDYIVIVEYYIGEERFENELNFYKYNFKVGQVIEILYLDNDYNNITYKQYLYFGPILVFSFGVLTFILDLFLIKKFISRGL